MRCWHFVPWHFEDLGRLQRLRSLQLGGNKLHHLPEACPKWVRVRKNKQTWTSSATSLDGWLRTVLLLCIFWRSLTWIRIKLLSFLCAKQLFPSCVPPGKIFGRVEFQDAIRHHKTVFSCRKLIFRSDFNSACAGLGSSPKPYTNQAGGPGSGTFA